MAGSVRAEDLGGEVAPRPPEPGFPGVLRAIDRSIAKVEGVALVAVVAFLLFLGVYVAIIRNFFPPCPFWVDEAIRYCVFFLGLVGGALATQSDRLFNIDMLSRLFSPRGKLALRIVTACFGITVAWIFLSSSLVLRTIIIDEKGEFLPPRTGLLALPIAMGLIILHFALHALIDGYYLVTGKPSPDLKTSEPKVH